MKLSRIAEEIGAAFTGAEVEISGVIFDSRRVEKGSLFCCLVGEKTDGHRFAQTAMDQGAAALICSRPLPLDIPQLIVEDGRLAMAKAAACFYGHPEREMTLLGVTGTNGKTSVTYMVKAVAEAAGKKVGLIGTIQNLIADQVVYTERTTPESVDLFALLRRMADSGVELVVMEVSSHALCQQRVAGLPFKAGLFTNLSQDHLDYHKTFENYRAAKKKLFSQSDVAILNGDDPAASYMGEGLPIPVEHIGIHCAKEYYAREIEITPGGASFRLFTPQGSSRLQLQVSGLFSVYNAMGTAALCLNAGMSLSQVRKGLEGLRGVAGRLESVNTGGRPYSVYVDYAHTPDALENILHTARGFTKGRLIALFGCGGDRDRGKRPIMGEIGGKCSDYVILTSDNPRSEDPYSILEAVEEGIRRTQTPYRVIEDRYQAIKSALAMAAEGDVVVIAGKGHESYQEVNGVRHHFDDKETVLSLLEM